MDDDIEDLTDALIEDTCHCCVCGASFTLGGNDYVLLEDCSGAFCVECAAAVHRAYGELLRQACVCEHGIADGDYCEPCNAEYRRARRAHGLDGD